MDEQNLEQRRARAALMRPHCQCLSRIGWALLGYMAAALGLQLAAMPLLGRFPGLAEQPLFSWGFSLVVSYGVCFPVFCLVMGPDRAPAPPRRQRIGPLRFGQLAAISVAALYLSSLISQAIIEVIAAARGRPVLDPVEQMLDYPLVCNLLLMCVAAPVCEEIMFRRLILNRLRPYGDAFAVTASALAFGLMHGNLSQMLYAFALGCVFGYVALLAGGIRHTILLHALINSISALLFPLAQRLGEQAEAALSLAILAAVVLGIVFFVALRRDIRLEPGAAELREGTKWRLLFTSPGFLLFCLAAVSQAALVLRL